MKMNFFDAKKNYLVDVYVLPRLVLRDEMVVIKSNINYKNQQL